MADPPNASPQRRRFRIVAKVIVHHRVELLYGGGTRCQRLLHAGPGGRLCPFPRFTFANRLLERLDRFDQISDERVRQELVLEYLGVTCEQASGREEPLIVPRPRNVESVLETRGIPGNCTCGDGDRLEPIVQRLPCCRLRPLALLLRPSS